MFVLVVVNSVGGYRWWRFVINIDGVMLVVDVGVSNRRR